MSSPAHPMPPEHVSPRSSEVFVELSGYHSTTAGDTPDDAVLTIDCDRCVVRGVGCADCVVTVLLGGPPDGVAAVAPVAPLALDDVERHAIDVLADAGLIPPLRMVEPVDAPRGGSDVDC